MKCRHCQHRREGSQDRPAFRSNDLEFCCRSFAFTSRKRYPTFPAAYPDSSNSLLGGSPLPHQNWFIGLRGHKVHPQQHLHLGSGVTVRQKPHEAATRVPEWAFPGSSMRKTGRLPFTGHFRGGRILILAMLPVPLACAGGGPAGPVESVIVRLEMSPTSAHLDAIGAEVRFEVVAREASGRAVPGVAPRWASSDPRSGSNRIFDR